MSARPQAFERVFGPTYALLSERAAKLPEPNNGYDDAVRRSFQAFIEATAAVWDASFFGSDGKPGAFEPAELARLSSAEGEKLFCFVLVGLIRFTTLGTPEIGDGFLQLLLRITPSAWDTPIEKLAASMRTKDVQHAENCLVDAVRSHLPPLRAQPVSRLMFVAYFSYIALLHQKATASLFAQVEAAANKSANPSPERKQATRREPAEASGGSSNWLQWVAAIALVFLVVRCNSAQNTSLTTSTRTPHVPSYSTPEQPPPSVAGIEGNYYRNTELGLTVPIPPNWTSMTAQESEARRSAARDYFAYGPELQRKLDTPQPGVATLFSIRPKSDAGWRSIPMFSGIREPLPAGMTDAQYRDRSRAVLMQHFGSAIVSVENSQLNCSGRTLLGFDARTLASGESGFLSIYVTTQRGSGVAFVLRAGEASTMQAMKKLASGIEMR